MNSIHQIKCRRLRWLWVIVILIFISTSLGYLGKGSLIYAGKQNETYRIRQRKQMVEKQIRQRGIKDENVLAAMKSVPRHLFVPHSLANRAYEDNPLPIGFDQTISQPYVVAYMTETATLTKEDKVLEIGTGSGYQAAVLAEIASEVFSIEILPELATRSRNLLNNLGYLNLTVKSGDGYR